MPLVRLTGKNSNGRAVATAAASLICAAVLAGGCAEEQESAPASAKRAAPAEAPQTELARSESAKAAPPAKRQRFTVSVSGDLLMHQPLLDRALDNGGGDHYDFAPFFRPVRRYIAGADVALCHLETPLAPGTPATYPIFRTPPALAKSIAKAGWDGCQTASNHSLDQGAAGIRTTGRALDRAGVAHTGSFASRRASSEPTLIRVRRGLKIGLVAYTDATNGLPLPTPWAVNLIDLDSLADAEREIVDDARKARRAGADAVLVNLHWGAENADSPSSAQVALAKRLLDANAVAAVVGQGPHVVQRIDRFAGKFVVFSEGNLVSNQSAAAGLPAATQDGLIALLRFRVGSRRTAVERLRYLPTWVRPGDYAVLPADPDADPDHAAALRASRSRTIRAAGRGNAFAPLPFD